LSLSLSLLLSFLLPVEGADARREACWVLREYKDSGRWTRDHCMTAITQLVHHGMLIVPIVYTFGAECSKWTRSMEARVFAGDGSREARETELALAEHQGNYMASIVKRLAQP
ncbi:hypothetical protein HID58_094432, partial [Brassica napus]